MGSSVKTTIYLARIRPLQKKFVGVNSANGAELTASGAYDTPFGTFFKWKSWLTGIEPSAKQYQLPLTMFKEVSAIFTQNSCLF